MPDLSSGLALRGVLLTGLVAVWLAAVAFARSKDDWGTLARVTLVVTVAALWIFVYWDPGLPVTRTEVHSAQTTVTTALGAAVAALLALALTASLLTVEFSARWSFRLIHTALGLHWIVYTINVIGLGILLPLWVALNPSPSLTSPSPEVAHPVDDPTG